MKRRIASIWVNVVAVIATLVVNVLSNALPLNGRTAGQISDQFKVYFTPAGYVFSIWGLIYIGLVAFAIYQALPRQRENALLRRIDLLFPLSCAANIGWLFFWHYGVWGYLPTVVVMVALLVLLIAIYLNLGVAKAQVSTGFKWCVHVLFSVYLGWITVATIANVTAVLDYQKWNGGGIGPEAWTVIVLAAAVAIAAVMSFSRADIAYLLVPIWAFIGIATKQAARPAVSIPAALATTLVALLLALGVRRRYLSLGRASAMPAAVREPDLVPTGEEQPSDTTGP